MQPNSSEKRRSARPVRNTAASASGHEVFPSSAAVATFPAAARLEGSMVEGTVGAASARSGEQSYSAGSDALLSDASLGQRAPPKGSVSARANDLIGELREISAQVNRMMGQVDRAIHRLGEHAGEPLRR